MPDAPGLELIAAELNAAHPGSVLGTYHDRGQGCLIADPEQIRETLGWLTPAQRLNQLLSEPDTGVASLA